MRVSKWIVVLTLLVFPNLGLGNTNSYILGAVDWLPSNRSGLELWLRADGPNVLWQESAETNPADADADSVGRWKDESGNSIHLDQATAADQPTYQTDELINGSPTVKFDGSSDYLKNATGNIWSDDSAGTVAIIFKTNSAYAVSSSFTIMGSCDEATTNYRWYIRAPYSDTIDYAAILQKENDTTDAVRGGTSLGTSTVYALIVDSSGTAFTIWLNGGSESLTVQGGANNGDWFADVTNRDNLTVGALERTAVAEFWGTNILEIIVYNSQLTGSDRTNLENYLTSRSGT